MESSAAPAGSAANPLLALLRDETAVAPPVATSEPPPPPPPVDEFEALSVAPAFKQALREARVEAATGATLVAVGCSQLASLAEMSEEDVQSLALPAEEEAKVLALTAGYRCGRAEGAAAATAAAAAQRPHSMFASPVSAAAAGSGSMFGSMASPPLGAAGMTSGGPPLTDANRPANAYGPNAIAITSTSIWDLFKRVGDHMGPGVFDLQGQTLTQDHAPSGRPHVFELTKHSVTLCNGTLVLTARQRVLLKGCRNVCFEDVTFATPPTQQPHGGDGGLLSQFGAMATLGGGFLAAGATNGRVMGSTAAAAAGAARPGTGAAVVAGGADGRPEETFPMLEAAAGAEVKFARCAFVCHDPSYSYCIKVAGAEQMQGTSKPTDVALSSCRLESSSDDVILAYVNNGAKLKADDTPMTGGDSVMVARGGADVVLDGCELSKARGPAAAKLAAGLGSPAGSFTAGAARGERPPLVGWVFNGDGLLASGAGTKVTATRCKFRCVRPARLGARTQ